VSEEVARSESKQFSLRLWRAQFRARKTLEKFDFERLPKLNRTRVSDLAADRSLALVALLIIDDFSLKPLRSPADEV